MRLQGTGPTWFAQNTRRGFCQSREVNTALPIPLVNILIPIYHPPTFFWNSSPCVKSSPCLSPCRVKPLLLYPLIYAYSSAQICLCGYVADKTPRQSEIWGPNPRVSLPYSYPNLETIWGVPACQWGLKLSPCGVFTNRHHDCYLKKELEPLPCLMSGVA